MLSSFSVSTYVESLTTFSRPLTIFFCSGGFSLINTLMNCTYKYGHIFKTKKINTCKNMKSRNRRERMLTKSSTYYYILVEYYMILLLIYFTCLILIYFYLSRFVLTVWIRQCTYHPPLDMFLWKV